MKKRTFQSICLFFLMILPFLSFAQVKKDKKSEEYYAKGIKLFREQNYTQAQKHFSSVKERPFNRVYTASLYMTGLCFYYNEEFDKALSNYQNLLNSYPQSVYTDDATYHKSLIMLKRPENRLGGLFLLSKLTEEGLNDELKQDALTAYKSFLYKEADLKFVKEYYDFIGEKHLYRSLVLEVLCYKLYQEKNWDEITKYLHAFQEQGGMMTQNLKIWDTVPLKQKKKNPKVRIAAILPFQANKTVTQLNTVASWAVELLEGMQLAVLMNQEPLPVDIIVRAFDSKNDVKTTESLLQNEIKEFKPDYIIGDVLNPITKVIGQYAEEHKITQMIPISPVEGLVEGKKFVYLVNSSMKTQITGLGNYAAEKLALKKVMIIGDNTPLSEIQVPLFESALVKAELKPIIHKLPSNLEKDKWYFKSLATELQEKSCQAVFIASNNESVVKQLLTEFKNKNLRLRVLGSTDWGKFKEIDAKTLSYFNSTFTDGYFTRNDSTTYSRFSKQYTETFKQVPSRYACLGYDIISYVISLKLNYPNMTFSEAIEKATPYKGLVQNYYYSKAQDNQSLQILEYRNGKIEKVKLW